MRVRVLGANGVGRYGREGEGMRDVCMPLSTSERERDVALFVRRLEGEGVCNVLAVWTCERGWRGKGAAGRATDTYVVVMDSGNASILSVLLFTYFVYQGRLAHFTSTQAQRPPAVARGGDRRRTLR